MAQSKISCDAAAMGKTRVIRTNFFFIRRRRSPAACRIFLGIATPVAISNFTLKIVRLPARFFTHFRHPRQNFR